MSERLGALDVRFWTFFAYTLAVLVVVLFALFFAHRVLALLLSRLLSYWTWRKYSVHFELGSIQFALLGGRISFHNLRYYSKNQSIFVLQGHIVFRYWKRRVREESDVGSQNEKNLMCRLGVHVNGIEWIIYNRTPIYDWIEQLLKAEARKSAGNSSETAAQVPVVPELLRSQSLPSLSLKTDKNNKSVTAEDANGDFTLRRLLPIQFTTGKGCVLVGTPDIPSILILDWSKVEGSYAAVKSRSSLDYYKSILNIHFRKVKCQLRNNADFKTPLLNTQIHHFENQNNSRTPYSSWIRKCLTKIGLVRSTGERAQQPTTEWHGLLRYQLDEMPQTLAPTELEEYARVTNIFETKSLTLSYYVDYAGKTSGVPHTVVRENDLGNGDLDPEWGVDLVFTTTNVNYGPWADRQRNFMQAFFFPPTNSNITVTQPLSSGDDRLFTSLKFFVEFKDTTTWRIPIREMSKHYTQPRNEHRESIPTTPATVAGSSLNSKLPHTYGWVDLKFKAGSSVHIMVPMVVSNTGYTMAIQVNMDDLSVYTSLNYSEMLIATRFSLSCRLNSPCVWNEERTWEFDFTLTQPKIFLLRDHITLLQDLVQDWTTGPPTEQIHFIPMVYKLDFSLQDLQIFMCVNDLNVIDLPNDLEDNTYIVLKSPKWKIQLLLPFLDYCSPRTAIDVFIEGDKSDISMSFPFSNTIGVAMSANDRSFLTMRYVTMHINYDYHNSLRPTHLDTLLIDINMSTVELTMWGFLTRYMLVLVDNYLGLTTSFITLDEYRQRKSKSFIQPTTTHQLPPSNAFETVVDLTISDGKILLPENLYSKHNCSIMSFKELQLQNRNMATFQDLILNMSPISWTRTEQGDQSRLALQSLCIHGLRKFGPPPQYNVYHGRWTIDLGKISGLITPHFFVCASQFLSCFMVLYNDKDNVTQPDLPTALDVIELALHIRTIDVLVRAKKARSIGSLIVSNIDLYYNNLAHTLFASRSLLCVRQFEVRLLWLFVDNDKDIYVTSNEWTEVGRLTTSLNYATYARPSKFGEFREKQQAFLSQNIPSNENLILLSPITNRSTHPQTRTATPSSKISSGKSMPSQHSSNPLLQSLSEMVDSEHDSLSFRTASDDTDSATHRKRTLSSLATTTSVPVTMTASNINAHLPLHQQSYKSRLAKFSVIERPTENLGLRGKLLIAVYNGLTDKPIIGKSNSYDRRLYDFPVEEHHISLLEGRQSANSSSVSIVDVADTHVLVTLDALRAATDLMQILNTQTTIELETLFDRMYMQLLQQAEVSTNTIVDTSLYLILSRLTMHCAQELLLPRSLLEQLINPHTAREHEQPASCVNTVLEHLTVTHFQSSQVSSLDVEIGIASAECGVFGSLSNSNIAGIADHARIVVDEFPLSPHSIVVGQVKCENVHAKLRHDVTNGDTSIHVDHSYLSTTMCPVVVEILTGSILAWDLITQRLVNVFTETSYLLSNTMHTHVLSRAQTQNISHDLVPRFLVRPSNLWRMVTRTFQSSPRWKLYWFLRSQLISAMREKVSLRDQHLNIADPDSVAVSSIGNNTAEAAMRQLLSKLAAHSHWGLHESVFDPASILHTQESGPSLIQSIKKGAITLVWRVGTVFIGICEGYAIENCISTTDLSLSVRYDLGIHNNLKALSTPAPITSPVGTISTSVTVAFRIKSIDVQLAPSLLHVMARTMDILDILMWRQKTSITPTSAHTIAPTTYYDNLFSMLTTIAFDIGQISIKVQAASLMLEFILDTILVNYSNGKLYAPLFFGGSGVGGSNEDGVRGFNGGGGSSISLWRPLVQQVGQGSRGSTRSAIMMCLAGYITIELCALRLYDIGVSRSQELRRLIADLSWKDACAHVTGLIPSEDSTSDSTILIYTSLSLHTFTGQLQQSMLTLYAMFEEWYALMEPSVSTIRQLATKFQYQESSSRASNIRLVRMEIVLTELMLHFIVLPSLSVEYRAFDFLFLLDQTHGSVDNSTYHFAAEILAEELVLISTATTNQQPTWNSVKTVPIPTISVHGQSSSAAMSASVFIDRMEAHLSVGLLDDLFTAQSVLSKDILDALDLVVYVQKRLTRDSKQQHHKQLYEPDIKTTSTESTPAYGDYTLKLLAQGVALQIESPQSVLFFDTGPLIGHVTSKIDGQGLQWMLNGLSPSLSLSHSLELQNSNASLRTASANRYRLAYILFELECRNGNQETPMSIHLKKAHCAMQPIALRRFTDFCLFFKTELSRRRDAKIAELSIIAENTKRALASMNVEIPTYAVKSNTSLLSRIFTIHIEKVGIALALRSTEGSILDPHQQKSGLNENPSAAILFFLRSFELTVQTSLNAYILIQGVSLVCTPYFDQTNEMHFLPTSHSATNCILISHIEGRLLEVLGESTVYRGSLAIRGMECHIDSQLHIYVRYIIRLWQNSKAQVYQFTQELLSTPVVEAEIELETKEALIAKTHTEVLKVEVTIVVESGLCKLKYDINNQTADDATKHALGGPVDSLMLPSFTVRVSHKKYFNYTITDLPDDLNVSFQFGTFTNVVHPSIIGFLVGISDAILQELRLGNRNNDLTPKPASITSMARKSNNDTPQTVGTPKNSIRISVRLAESSIELRSLPGTRVIAMACIQSGQVALLHNSDIKHPSTSASCCAVGLSLTIKSTYPNSGEYLTFTVPSVVISMAALSHEQPASFSCLIDVDPLEIVFAARRLAEVTQFVDVWTEAAKYETSPITPLPLSPLNTYTHSPDPVSSANGSSLWSRMELVLRIKDFQVKVDLGYHGLLELSITNIFCSRASLSQTYLTHLMSIVSARIKSHGRLHGEAVVRNFLLTSQARNPNVGIKSTSSLVNTSITHVDILLSWHDDAILAGNITGVHTLTSCRWIVSPSSTLASMENIIQLRKGQIVISTRTLPAIISHAHKIAALFYLPKAESTHQPSSLPQSGSKSFSTKPIQKQPLHPSGKSTVLIDELVLTLFAERFQNPENIQIHITEMVAQLSQHITALSSTVTTMTSNSSMVIERDLKFSVRSIEMSRFMNRASIAPPGLVTHVDFTTLIEWIISLSQGTKESIVKVPSTDLSMVSKCQYADENGNSILDYELQSVFKDMIDVSLNLNLYKKLQELLVKYMDDASRSLRESATTIHSTSVMSPSGTAAPSITSPSSFSSSTTPSLLMDRRMGRRESTELTSDGIVNPNKEQQLSSSLNAPVVTYRMIKPVKFDPRLRIMGEATPSLSWLGLNKEQIPEWCHEMLTLRLESVLAFVSNTHSIFAVSTPPTSSFSVKDKEEVV